MNEQRESYHPDRATEEDHCYRCGSTEHLLADTGDRSICQACYFKQEQAQVEAERYERQDDYNVFEENQIMLDNEGGDE